MAGTDDTPFVRVDCLGGSYLIDVADIPLLGGYVGCIHDGYVRIGTLIVHRVITGAKKGQVVDHINGDPTDNRRANLRICTTQQNLWNGSSHRDSATKYRGVSRRPGRKVQAWRAQICKDYKVMLIGTYATQEEAARAYDAAALLHFGEFARLNFPPAKSHHDGPGEGLEPSRSG